MDNKAIVKAYIERVFNAHDLGCIDEYMHDDYVQHNPNVAQGKAGFVEFFRNVMFKKFPDFRQEIKHMYAEGDLVLVHLLAVAKPGEVENIVFDVYRLRDGKLAEHWDCIQHLTPEQIPLSDAFF